MKKIIKIVIAIILMIISFVISSTLAALLPISFAWIVLEDIDEDSKIAKVLQILIYFEIVYIILQSII